MTFDATTNQLLLFGGDQTKPPYYLKDSWVWTGTTWTSLSPSQSPGARRNAAMAYDAGTGQLVLFGGWGPTGATKGPADADLSDSWTFNGTTWLGQTSATSLAARYGESVAYDAKTGAAVMFGGDSATSPLGDTWSFSKGSWTPIGSGPPARSGAAMAFDSATGDVVLFGGSGSAGLLADTWVFDGSAWHQEAPATSPSPRSGAAMSYDSATGQMLLFGGMSANSSGSSYLDDTWVWSGTNWNELSPAHSPSVREGASLAYDAAASGLLLFGGDGPDSNSPDSMLGDTWAWNGSDWTQQCLVGCANGPYGTDTAIAYDASTGEMLHLRRAGPHGCRRHLGVERDILVKLSPDTAPTPRLQSAAAYDPVLDRIVLFGGYGAPAWRHGRGSAR